MIMFLTLMHTIAPSPGSGAGWLVPIYIPICIFLTMRQRLQPAYCPYVSYRWPAAGGGEWPDSGS